MQFLILKILSVFVCALSAPYFVWRITHVMNEQEYLLICQTVIKANIVPVANLCDRSLPVDLFALIVQKLTLHNLMQVAAINRYFVNEVLPLLQTLFLFKIIDLRVPQARWFVDGKIDCIWLCILYEMGGSDNVDDTECRCMTFLRIMSKLSQVYYGWICYDYGRLDR